MMNLAPHQMPTKQRGVTLIEVLVAALVLAIGLLGLASLQATAVRFNHEAMLRTQAVNLAYQMADAMRANVAAAEAERYEYNRSFGDAWPTGDATIAKSDLRRWGTRIGEQLPSGDGQIDVARDGPDRFVATISVRWQERHVVDDGVDPYGTTEISFETRL